MSKVLITGGAGFIGKAVARKLKKEGLNVVTFDILEPKEKIGRHYLGTIMYVDELEKAMEGCTYVIHLAAMLGVKRTETNRTGCLDVNIHGTKNVFDACRNAKIKKIIFASSSEVYGEPIKNPISENDFVMPKSVYAVTKLVGEEYARAYKQEYGLDYSIVRFFNAYGPDQTPEFVVPRFVRSVMNNESPTVYGRGNQERCFCHVNDTARGVYLALKNPKASGEIFNIGNSTTKITTADLARKIIAISGKKLKPEFIDMKDSDRTKEREIIQRIADTRKAQKILGFKAEINLEEGIRDIFEKNF